MSCETPTSQTAKHLSSHLLPNLDNQIQQPLHRGLVVPVFLLLFHAKAERESAASGGGSTLEKRERIKAADARVEQAMRVYDMLPESKRNPNEFENLIDKALARWADICA